MQQSISDINTSPDIYIYTHTDALHVPTSNSLCINELITLIFYMSFSMASVCFFSCPVFRNKNYNAKSCRGHICSRIYSSQSTSMAFTADENVVRRTANYEPTLWSYGHIQSLSSKYMGRLPYSFHLKVLLFSL